MSVVEQYLTYPQVPDEAEFAYAIPKACGVGALVIGTATNSWNDRKSVWMVNLLDQQANSSVINMQYRALSSDQDAVDSILEWWFPEGVEECRTGTLRQALSEILCADLGYPQCADFTFEHSSMLVTKLVASLMANDGLGCARWVVGNLHALYPLSPAIRELRKLVQPGVPNERRSTIQTRRQDTDWLSANRQRYLGKWVVLHEGQLIHQADSLTEAVKHAQEANLPQKPEIYHVI